MSDNVNHPKHYTQFPLEVIDMMIKIWGKERVADYCEINAFKYRMRAGVKYLDLAKIQEDYDKEKWYLNKSKELRQNAQLNIPEFLK